MSVLQCLPFLLEGLGLRTPAPDHFWSLSNYQQSYQADSFIYTQRTGPRLAKLIYNWKRRQMLKWLLKLSVMNIRLTFNVCTLLPTLLLLTVCLFTACLIVWLFVVLMLLSDLSIRCIQYYHKQQKALINPNYPSI